MQFRVVMQGRTLGGADVVEVKRNFVRVTGLPETVVEELFVGMPQVIKRQVPQSDAERIAATLRAIGAAATVERELTDSEEQTDEGIQIIATPLSAGPPTIVPGSDAAESAPAQKSRAAGALRKVTDHWQVLLGAVVVVGGAVLAAPMVSDLVANMRRVAPTPKVAAARAPAAAVEPVESTPLPNGTLLHGPWRCTDQRTGLATYWSYDPDGSLVSHGDALRDKPTSTTASAPTAWKLDARRLSFVSADGAARTYAVSILTLSRLHYGDDRGLEVECRRP